MKPVRPARDALVSFADARGTDLTDRRSSLAVIAAITAAILAAAPAHALSFKDISGKWCTAAGSSQFTEKAIIVRKSDGSRIELKIDHYVYADDAITVFWVAPDQSMTSTTYGDFGADGRTMAQFTTDNGPRRAHRRC
jgi:hypothetical protein